MHSCSQRHILISLVKLAIFIGRCWEFGRGEILKDIMDMLFFLGVRGGGTESGVVQLPPKLTPLVLGLSVY